MKDNLVEEIPGYQKWIDAAKDSAFFGKKLQDMSKEELLGVIGWMREDGDRQMTQTKKDHELFMNIEKSKPKTPTLDFVDFCRTFPKRRR